MKTTTNLTEFKSSTWPEKAFMRADAAWVLQANGTNSAMLATVRSHTTPVAAPSTQKGANRQSNNVCMPPVYLNNQHLPQHTTSSPYCKLLGYETLTTMKTRTCCRCRINTTAKTAAKHSCGGNHHKQHPHTQLCQCRHQQIAAAPAVREGFVGPV